MSTDLYVLTWTVVLFILMVVVPSTGRIVNNGFPWGLGPRDTTPENPAWIGRADRAARNMAENLLPFAILVLVANVSGAANEATASGAALFLGARVVYAPAYIFAIPYVRTIAFGVGLAGELRILGAIL